MHKLLFILLLCSGSSFAQETDKSIPNIFKDKTKIENPFELRDPFKMPQTKAEGQKNSRGFFKSDEGTYSNLNQVDLSTFTMDKIRVNGVLIGKERRVLISMDGSKDVVTLKEGDKIGPDKAELKAILPGGIVLVEKIINVYGMEEYLETVIPISR